MSTPDDLKIARIARRYRNALSELLAECAEREVFSEGQLVEITGFDRVAVRELIDWANIEGPRMGDVPSVPGEPRSEDDIMAVRVRYGATNKALTELFADGQERRTGDVAKAMRLSSTAASQALRRSSAVVRVRPGVWRAARASESHGSGGAS